MRARRLSFVHSDPRPRSQGLGIRRRWCAAIAQFVAAQAESSGRVTFCVEGNIGAGKSTYLSMVKASEGSARGALGAPRSLLGRAGSLHAVSYTHLTLPTKRIV